MIENGPDVLNGHPGIAPFLWSIFAWMGDPTVMTAIASLLTAIAAFFRVRHRRGIDPRPSRETTPEETPLIRAYETLHAVEEKIREELVLQLQTLQEEAELIGQELSAYQQANTALRETITCCPEPGCPMRTSMPNKH